MGSQNTASMIAWDKKQKVKLSNINSYNSKTELDPYPSNTHIYYFSGLSGTWHALKW